LEPDRMNMGTPTRSGIRTMDVKKLRRRGWLLRSQG
jgi:hypothetical protein